MPTRGGAPPLLPLFRARTRGRIGPMKTDIEIAQANVMQPISQVAADLGLSEDDFDLYGKYKAKLTIKKLRELQAAGQKGKLVLVTAITPTPAGEGKSTVSIALAKNRQKIRSCPSGTFSGSLFRYQRRCLWWRLRTDCSYGRHQPALYR